MPHRPRWPRALDRVAQWQARRLNATYADLAADPRYAEAIASFKSRAVRPGDFSRRDADLARVVPIMIRVLPDAVVATVAMAMELSTLSHELDHALVGKLDASAPFTGARLLRRVPRLRQPRASASDRSI